MKLKQRVSFGLGLLVICVILFLAPGVMENPKDIHNQLNHMFIQRHQREEKSVDPADLQQNLIQDIKGHLNVARKDLDVSNYTSNNKGSSELGDQNNNNNNLNLKLPINLPESELLDYVLHDKTLTNNADKLIHIARILENSRRLNGGLIPANLTKEFVPDKGDIVMPGGIYHDLDIKYDWERRKMPVNIQLTPEIEEKLELIVNKLSVSHQRKKGRKRAAKLKLYESHK